MIHKLFLAWFALFFCRFDTDSSGGNTTQSSTTTNLDKRLVVDGGSVGVTSDSSTVNVSSLDGGAIDRAFGFAKAGLDSALFGTGEALDFAKKSQQAGLDFAVEGLDFARAGQNSGLDFAGVGLDRAFDVMMKSMDTQAESEKAALAFASRAADNAMNFAFDAGKPDASLAQKALSNDGKILMTLAAAAAVVVLFWGKIK